jgi:predicted flap endonuclease-1-like 5' DNA nuclease
MIDQLTNPTVITVATAALALASAAAYSYFTGYGVSVDVDNDGKSEVTFDGEENPQMSPEEAVEKNSSAKEVFNATEKVEGETLLDVKGVGPTLAETLEQNGIYNAGDLRRATDDELLEVSGIGPSKLETIRNDL